MSEITFRPDGEFESDIEHGVTIYRWVSAGRTKVSVTVTSTHDGWKADTDDFASVPQALSHAQKTAEKLGFAIYAPESLEAEIHGSPYDPEKITALDAEEKFGRHKLFHKQNGQDVVFGSVEDESGRHWRPIFGGHGEPEFWTRSDP